MRLRLTRRQDESRSGFTLIELMVVVVLIGIISAMVIPEMRGTYEDALLRSTGRTLVDAFTIAYSQAITTSRLHRVRLDRKTGHYVVERTAREGEAETGFIPLRDLPGGQGTLDIRISIQVRREDETAGPGEQSAPALAEAQPGGETEEVMAFYPDGTADSREILLRDRQGFRLSLRINPITARVRVLELDRELE